MQNWAYGPPGNNGGGWRDTPWSGRFGGHSGSADNPYNLAPGGVVEETEEGGTLPANVANIATVTADQVDATHNHYHIGDGRQRSRGRRGGGRRAEFIREYANLTRERDRDDGVLGLVDRERDRELDRNMVDRDLASRRDLRMMSMLDRERERDRGGTDVMGLLERELDRRRDMQPDESKKLKAREESSSEDEGGLRAEIEALRKDFKRLLRGPPAAANSTGAKQSKCNMSGGMSAASRSLGQQKSSAVDVQFNRRDSARKRSEDGGDDNDDAEAEEEDDGGDNSSASSVRDISGLEVREAGRALRRAARRDEES